MIDIYIYKNSPLEVEPQWRVLYICASERSLFLLDTLIGNEGYDDYSQCYDDITNLVAILYSLLINVMSCLIIGVFVDTPSDGCQNSVPYTCTDSSVEQELAYVHACQSCRNTDELANGWHQSSKNGRGCTMLAEILLGYFHLLAVDQAHVTDSAISKAIDDRATYPFSQIVVDEGTRSAPMVANTMTRINDIPLFGSIAFHAAGGTTTSDGKGMKELSIAINSATTQ